MKASELRRKSAAELQALVLDLRREQFNLRMQLGSGQSIPTSRLQGVRREIARTKTVLVELGRGGGR
ncbi:MAG: 50S ribosomal protein L29 [Gammaproteobacteria bacterium]